MRICLVSSELAPFSGWGVGTATAGLARAMRAAGHEVHILTNPAPGLTQLGPAEFPGTTIHTLDPSADASLDHHPCRATRRPHSVYERIKALHESHQFNSIHFNDFYADAAFTLNARRTLGHFSDSVIAIHLHSAIALLRRLNQQIEADLEATAIQLLELDAIRAADLLISPSHAMLEKLRELSGDRTVTTRAEVIPYAFDVARVISRLTAPTIASADPATPEILFFGRLEYRKGIHLLTSAAQQLLDSGIDLRVRIVGADSDTSPTRASMRAWLHTTISRKHQDKFLFHDNLPQESLGPYIRAAAVCCCPSLWENFPNVCLEAMSLGKLVVASDAGGIPEIINHSANGLLFKAGDAASLAATLRTALTDPTLTSICTSAAPERIRTLCDPSQIAARTAAAIKAARDATKAALSHRPGEAGPVTAIVPFYNLAEFLPEAIASLRAQTRPPDEIIIVDDGSTQPGAADLLSRFEREGIRVLRKANGGLASARNAGLNAAQHRWVLPLDADDTLHPRFIECALTAAAHDPSLAVITSLMKCYTDSPDNPTIGFVPFSADPTLLPVVNTASSAIALLDRQAVLAAGGYDETFFAFEDWDLWCSLARRKARFAVIPEYLVFNRIRPTSMLRTLSVDQYHLLRARLLDKHANLSPNPHLTLRMMLAESMHYQRLFNIERSNHPAPSAHAAPDLADAVRTAISSTPRYRLADRINDLVKRTGLHPLLKSMWRRTRSRPD